jgi:hypothetical protein
MFGSTRPRTKTRMRATRPWLVRLICLLVLAGFGASLPSTRAAVVLMEEQAPEHEGESERSGREIARAEALVPRPGAPSVAHPPGHASRREAARGASATPRSHPSGARRSFRMLCCPLPVPVRGAHRRSTRTKETPPPLGAAWEGIMLRPEDARKILLEGNARYREALKNGARRRPPAIAETSLAAMLTCTRLRPPPPVLFDLGLGAMYVVSRPGARPDADVARDFQYAGVALQTRLFVVLGHLGCTACGDPTERRNGLKNQGRHEEASRRAHQQVISACAELSADPWFEPRIRAGAIDVAGAVFDPTSGIVTFHPIDASACERSLAV